MCFDSIGLFHISPLFFVYTGEDHWYEIAPSLLISHHTEYTFPLLLLLPPRGSFVIVKKKFVR